MKPTLQDIRIDPLLTKLSLAYQNADYIAEKICPVIPSSKITGKYYKFDTSKFRPSKSLRGMGASAEEVGYGLEMSDPYVCKDHALKQLVPDELKDQAEGPFNPQMAAVENVAQKLLVEKEYALATYMQTTGTFGTNYTTLTVAAGTRWDIYATSDPIGDIETGIESVRSQTFRPANTLVLGQETWNKLKHHPDLIDRIKYGGYGKMSPQALADLLDLDQVIIGAAGRESAVEGQDSSLAYIWGKYAWLVYIPKRPAIDQPAFAYHMQHKKSVDKWYDKDREGTWVREHDFYVRETVLAAAAYLIVTAVS